MEFDQWKTGLFWKISGGQEPGRVQQRWRLTWLWLRPPLVSSTSNPCFKAEQKVQGMLVCPDSPLISPPEIVNSDKIQVFKGLDIATNKVTEEECKGIPHHLLGVVEPGSNFTAKDFRIHAAKAVESIVSRDRLPIIAGKRYDCCFLWVDVSLPVLYSFVSERVDEVKEF
ncbi:hypothetical protein LWI29_016480 [Acer saccharum]|uniref:Uncharacterized protein n=1 Tax=Acer saccharum TaxID=4024 RepID=A0AA39W1T5_ACESA|nr:hypothetical protein LWI29_016480 [Acer saccharum]